MTKEQALDTFWNSFGWEAYDENTVPDEVILPHITYTSATDSIDRNVALSASLWDRSTSWASVTNKKNQINDYIGLGGVLVPYNGGAIWIRRGQPFAQRMSDVDDGIRRIYLNITAEYISAD